MKPRRLTRSEWEIILVNHGFRCLYCGIHADDEALTQDHKVPQSRDGFNTATNVVPACRSCNSRKGNRTAAEFMALPRPFPPPKEDKPHARRATLARAIWQEMMAEQPHDYRSR